MKLFLSGGGSDEDSLELDKKFASILNTSKPLLYIPIAINTLKHPYAQCLEWLKKTFRPLGVHKFVMWTEKELSKAHDGDFNSFGGIYIGGGNTFKLLKNLKDFGILDILKGLAERDIPMYGGSAGAVLLARTSIPALCADPDDVGLKELDSLNLIWDYDIFPHYESSQDKTIRGYMKKYHLKKVIGLPENCGLYVHNKKIQVVGLGSAFVFLKEIIKEVKPHNHIV